MATKTETPADLKKEIKALKASLKDAEAAQGAAEDAYATAAREHTEDIAKLKEDATHSATVAHDAHAKALADLQGDHQKVLAGLQADYDSYVAQRATAHATELAAAKAAAAVVPPPSLGKLIGPLQMTTGMLAIGDTHLFDTAWKRAQDTHSRYVVDFEGPHAEQLANRSKSNSTTVEQLCDGKWRLTTAGNRSGVNAKHTAERLIAQNGWTDTVTAAPILCSRQQVIDASRASGVGLIAGGLYAGVTAKSAKLYASQDAGKTTLHIVLS